MKNFNIRKFKMLEQIWRIIWSVILDPQSWIFRNWKFQHYIQIQRPKKPLRNGFTKMLNVRNNIHILDMAKRVKKKFKFFLIMYRNRRMRSSIFTLHSSVP